MVHNHPHQQAGPAGPPRGAAVGGLRGPKRNRESSRANAMTHGRGSTVTQQAEQLPRPVLHRTVRYGTVRYGTACRCAVPRATSCAAELTVSRSWLRGASRRRPTGEVGAGTSRRVPAGGYLQEGTCRRVPAGAGADDDDEAVLRSRRPWSARARSRSQLAEHQRAGHLQVQRLRAWGGRWGGMRPTQPLDGSPWPTPLDSV